MLRFETLMLLVLYDVGGVLGTKKALLRRLLNDQVVWQDDDQVWRRLMWCKSTQFSRTAGLYENQCLERSCLEYGINFR